jgi:hypothetical protein
VEVQAACLSRLGDRIPVMDFREETQLSAARYLEKLKERLKKRFDQLDVLITLQELLAI